MFQSRDLSANLFSYEDLKIFINRQMNQDHINRVKSIDPTFVPRGEAPLNRTVVHIDTHTVVQMDINLNLCEIVLPPNQAAFKSRMFKNMVNFMIRSVKLFTTPKTANEMGFKIFFYAPAGSLATQSQWWADTGITEMSWRTDQASYGQTILGTPLDTPHVRFILLICLDENYNLVKEPKCTTQSMIPSRQQNDGWAVPTHPARALTNPVTTQPTTNNKWGWDQSHPSTSATQPPVSQQTGWGQSNPSTPNSGWGQSQPSTSTTQPQTGWGQVPLSTTSGRPQSTTGTPVSQYNVGTSSSANDGQLNHSNSTGFGNPSAWGWVAGQNGPQQGGPPDQPTGRQTRSQTKSQAAQKTSNPWGNVGGGMFGNDTWGT